MPSIIKKAALCFIAAMLLIISLRALNPDRWSGWDFGDAQTLLSLNQWDKRGPLECKLLFAPQGYAPFMELLDEGELRRHAHGISPRASPAAGPRLLYTHYPAGYLLPQAAVYLTGIQQVWALRIMQAVFSCCALVFLFLTFELLAGPAAALCGLIFYAVSPAFLSFADSLANQPIDDLFRFAFMFLILAGKKPEKQLWFNRAAWFCLFLLSLCSYDSVIFCLLWVAAADYISGERINPRRLFIFALAPVAAGILQLAQNSWYLGFATAAADIKSTLLMRMMTHSSLREKFINAIYPYYFSFGKAGFLAALGCGAAIAVYWKDKRFSRAALSLLACGAAFMVALPSAASLSYQTRQLMPFISFCFASAIAGFFFNRDTGRAKVIPAVLLTAVFTGFIWRLPGQFRPGPITKDINISLARALDKIPTEKPAVLFELGFFTENGCWERDFVEGYHQPHPLLEYYFGKKLILSFSRPQDLAHDLRLILDKSKAGFSPIVAAKDKQALDGIISALKAEKIPEANGTIRTFSLGGRAAAGI